MCNMVFRFCRGGSQHRGAAGFNNQASAFWFALLFDSPTYREKDRKGYQMGSRPAPRLTCGACPGALIAGLIVSTTREASGVRR
jgi:hypothetical protein